MHLLLINPKLPDSFWSLKWAIHTILPGKRAVNPPLGLAIIAALCPRDWLVEIVDENVEEVPLDPTADIIGIGGMGVQAPRQRELLTYYRRRGHYVVAGGASTSLCPETYEGIADTIVAGEAEYIWPELCGDFMAGRPRTKSPEQIGRELNALRELGAHSVFFVDDNMIGNKNRAKMLLRYLADYQNRHRYVFSFGTEVSLNIAQDDKLLRLFQAAHFDWVFIGIESPDTASLKETGKTQNLREDILVSVRRIYARGIDVLAGFIIRFDNDTPQTFDAQFRFITAAGIQSAMIGLLSALPRTPLYARMEREGRLREIDEESDNTRLRTNIIPKTMSDEEVSRLYRDIYRRLLTDIGIGTRIRNKTPFLGTVGYGGGYTPGQSAGIVVHLLFRGIIPGRPKRIYHFLRSLPFWRPSLLPLAILDWIIGLSMRAFAHDHLWLMPPARAPELHLLNSVQAAIARHLSQDEVWVTRKATETSTLTIRLGTALKRRFFKAAAPLLCRLLEQAPVRVTLSAEDNAVAVHRAVRAAAGALGQIRRPGFSHPRRKPEQANDPRSVDVRSGVAAGCRTRILEKRGVTTRVVPWSPPT